MARKKGPQVQQAYNYIKGKILSFELPPGASVSDHALEQDLNMSRSPIREAIMRLAADGLIETTNQGTLVASMMPEDIAEICQVRKAVEVAAVNIIMDRGSITAQQKERMTDIYNEVDAVFKKFHDATDPYHSIQIDDLFHREIMMIANNSRLTQIYDRMRIQIYRARWLSVVLPDRSQEIVHEHEEIYNALIKNDRALAVKSLSHHLEQNEKNYARVLMSPHLNPQFLVAMANITNIHKQQIENETPLL